MKRPIILSAHSMRVRLNSPGFSYDVHSLVKAFFPREEVKIDMGEGEDACDICVFVMPADIETDGVYSGYVRVSAGAGDRTDTGKIPFDRQTRAEVKSVVKKALYGVLSDITGKSLPWGTMTGIRPVKVPMKLIRSGSSDEAIRDHMKSVYLCSDEKISLATKIAHLEKEVTESLPENGFSLYVGIPFCPTTCMYCSFTSYPIAAWRDRTDAYLDALRHEMDRISERFAGRVADSIYIGGGTPTTLSAAQLSRLIGDIRERFDLSELREFTVEAGRPDSITEEKLLAIREGGADRISVNPQTMNDKTLELIGRRHTVKDVYTAMETARNAGFSNINTDLILGLPGEDEEDVRHTFRLIEELAPDSLTVHSLAVKRASAIHEYIAENGIHDDTGNMMRIATDTAGRLGLVPYYLYRQKNMSGNLENVGFARKDHPGIYNIVIMEEISDIVALGAGTISKRVFPDGRIERCDNVKDVAMYIDRIDEMIERKEKLFGT
ncbi:MAG: coproporphyrinogen dehydrogenase HemZ [Lachnospiraceae bacterium]|nr:coproporphyrinogen dehydrogenase HemZ [Lachnospiraceae bacterium]